MAGEYVALWHVSRYEEQYDGAWVFSVAEETEEEIHLTFSDFLTINELRALAKRVRVRLISSFGELGKRVILKG